MTPVGTSDLLGVEAGVREAWGGAWGGKPEGQTHGDFPQRGQ